MFLQHFSLCISHGPIQPELIQRIQLLSYKIGKPVNFFLPVLMRICPISRLVDRIWNWRAEFFGTRHNLAFRRLRTYWAIF